MPGDLQLKFKMTNFLGLEASPHRTSSNVLQVRNSMIVREAIRRRETSFGFGPLQVTRKTRDLENLALSLTHQDTRTGGY